MTESLFFTIGPLTIIFERLVFSYSINIVVDSNLLYNLACLTQVKSAKLNSNFGKPLQI